MVAKKNMTFRSDFNDSLKLAIDDESVRVIAITGKWGAGKTQAWDEFVEKTDYKTNDKYIYISLFGLSDKNEMKVALAADRLLSAEIHKKTNANTLVTLVKELLKKIPYFSGGSDLVLEIFTSQLSNLLICVDDIERRGKGLDIVDVLGYFEQLAIGRNCKIVAVLNDDQLNTEDKSKLDLFREKVVDREIVFKPHAAENAALICDGTKKFDQELIRAIVSLKLVNLRIVKRIRSAVTEYLNRHNSTRDEITNNIVTSTTLLGAIYLDREKSMPTIDFLRTNGSSVRLNRLMGESIDETETQWARLIQEFGWAHYDDLDEEIYQHFETGMLNVDKFDKYVKKMEQQFEGGDIQAEKEHAWSGFASGFSDNEIEFTTGLFDTYSKYLPTTSYNNITSVITQLREFDRNDMADELVVNWVSCQHANDPENINRNSIRFLPSLNDEALDKAMDNQYASHIVPITLDDILKEMEVVEGTKGSWSDVVINASEEEIYTALISLNTPDPLRSRSALEVSRILLKLAKRLHPDAGQRVENALNRISATSNINMIRVNKIISDTAT